VADDLFRLLHPGARVALADGVDTPLSLLAELSSAARDVGEISLLLGWAPKPLDRLDLDAFADVRTIMAGYSLRKDVDGGSVGYVPVRLATPPH
jgi:hypothetical protein